MKLKYSMESKIFPSMGDATGKLGYDDCFDHFMDTSSEHAADLGAGIDDLAARNQMWIMAKNKVVFVRRPQIGENVVFSTWMEKNPGSRCERCCGLETGDEILAYSKAEWVVFNYVEKRVVDISELYPGEYNYRDERFPKITFTKMNYTFPDEPFAAYKINANDIDFGGHMNNVAYIRALESLYTTEEWNELSPSAIEIQYKNPSYEGETLEFRKITEGDSLIVKGSVGERTSVYYKLTLK